MTRTAPRRAAPRHPTPDTRHPVRCTKRTARGAAPRHPTADSRHPRISWQCKRVEHPALGRRLRQVRHRVDESEGGGAVVRIELTGDDGTGPAADSGENRNVLLSVRSLVGDRLADDPGAAFELPEELTGTRVDRFEPPFHRAVEDDVARRRDRAAPDGKVLLDRPDLFAGDRIPRI